MNSLLEKFSEFKSWLKIKTVDNAIFAIGRAYKAITAFYYYNGHHESQDYS